VLAIDPSSYAAAAVAPQITKGAGVAALVADPSGVLISEELVGNLHLGPGDTLPVTVFPDDPRASRQLTLHVLGVYREFAPTDPLSELVITTRTLTAAPAPDFYLAKVAAGADPQAVAARLNAGPVDATTAADYLRQEQRGLTAVNLAGLSRVELTCGALIASIGVGVLGGFLVMERRREVAILRTIGAETRHILAAPALEGSIAAFGSLVIGVPIGLGLAILSARVLDLFFAQPPPLVVVPWGALVALAALVVGFSALALGVALLALRRRGVAAVLREP
jgi:putative ABC transport system permease protein